MSAAEIPALAGAGGQSGDVAGEAGGGEPCEPQAGGKETGAAATGGGPQPRTPMPDWPSPAAAPLGAGCCVLPRRRCRGCERGRANDLGVAAGSGERAAGAVAAFQAHGEATGFLLPYSPAVSGVRASVLVPLRRACCCSPLIAVCFARWAAAPLARRLLRFDDDRLSGGGESLLMLAPRGARRARGLAGTGRAFAAVSLRPLLLRRVSPPPLSARLSAPRGGRSGCVPRAFSLFSGRVHGFPRASLGEERAAGSISRQFDARRGCSEIRRFPPLYVMQWQTWSALGRRFGLRNASCFVVDTSIIRGCLARLLTCSFALCLVVGST